MGVPCASACSEAKGELRRGHELILGDEAVQRRHEAGTEAWHGDVPGEVSVPAGQTRATTYAFTVPGRLTYACHLPGHYAYGMAGTVRVLP